MRLLNTSTLKVEDFSSGKTPKYAILSHTWGVEEVTFEDISKSEAKFMPGFAKVTGCCALAEASNFRYIWIDTLCIDKKSSAELSEAINSMFKWYAEAVVCYTYMEDVPPNSYQYHILEGSRFRTSRWFQRGWTLQELLAPMDVVFFDSDWTEIGTKLSLRDTISEITSIPKEALTGETPIEDYTVGGQMSWASFRKTTRIEDMAYSLMGLFRINMPMLYGEGEKAFARLQHEIIKSSNDQTIFIWTRGDDGPVPFMEAADVRFDPFLANSPYQLRNFLQYDVLWTGRNTPFSVNNFGVETELEIMRCTDGRLKLLFDCGLESRGRCVNYSYFTLLGGCWRDFYDTPQTGGVYHRISKEPDLDKKDERYIKGCKVHLRYEPHDQRDLYNTSNLGILPYRPKFSSAD